MNNAIDSKWISNECQVGLVSVIIPTFNREVYLQQAIQSVYEQTYRPIECIIVDDGSTDNTKKEVNRFKEKKDEGFILKYFFQKNSGSQASRNMGTSASTGEFIQYLDSDDLLYPDKIKNQVEFFERNKDCDGVFGDWKKGTPNENELIKSYAGEDLITQFLTEHCVHTLSFLMRRTLVEKIGPWDINIKRNQEIDFQLRGLIEGGKYNYQGQECGLWRIHSNERIGNTTKLKDVLYFFQKWETLLRGQKRFTRQLERGIANTLYWFCIKNIEQHDANRIIVLKKAIKLNPEIPFFNSTKMKWLSKVLGTSLSIRCWILWFKFHKKNYNKLPEIQGT